MLDPFGEDRPRPKPVHEFGADLSALSVGELDARVALLEAEIARLKEARAARAATREAAHAFFSPGKQPELPAVRETKGADS